MSIEKVALVTGSNRGIGYTLVQHLARKFKGIVYLTARSDEIGHKAVEDLAKEGLKANYHQLDIDNTESIKRCVEYIKNKHGGLDLLVNNAAIAYKVNDETPFKVQAENTLRINFFSTLNVSNEFFKILRPHARVLNVSSRAGVLTWLADADIIAKLSSEKTNIDDIVKIANDFVEAARNGTYEKISKSAYGMSKACLNALTEVQQRRFNKDSRADLVVNGACPGYTSTGMTSFKGHSTEEAVVTLLHLATLPENTDVKGEFWAEMKPYDWKTAKFSIS